MRTRLMVILLLAAFGPAGPAPAQKVHLGFKVGMDRTSMVQDSSRQLRSTTHTIGVAFVTVQLLPYLSLQPELLAEGKGVRWPEYGGDAALTYFEMPVLARLDIRRRGIRPHVLVGPAFSVLHSCALEWDPVHIYFTRFVFDCTRRSWTSGSELSGIAGAGVDFPTRNATLHVEYRYEHGFTSITVPSRPRYYNRLSAIMVGVAVRPHPLQGS